MSDITLRVAGANDALKVAKLHLESWRICYRNLLSDEWLDSEVAMAERMRFWMRRMSYKTEGDFHILLAEEGENLVGFAALQPGNDHEYGIFLDNLHVLPNWQGLGIGKRLLAEMTQEVILHWPGKALQLTVVDGNIPARAFYSAMGGVESEAPDHTYPDGVILGLKRIIWHDVPMLQARLSGKI